MQQTDLNKRELEKLERLAREKCITCEDGELATCEVIYRNDEPYMAGASCPDCQGTGLKHPGLSRECTACHPGGTCPVNHWQNLGRSEILRCNYCVKVCRECKHERFASGRVPVSVAEARRWVVDRLLEKYEGLAIGDTDVGVAIYHMWYDSDGDLKVSQLAEEDTPALALFAALKWAEEI